MTLAVVDLLASTEAFAEFRGVQHDPTDTSALRALEDASEIVRALCHQTLSYVKDDAVELEGNWTHRLWLPERPVLDITSIFIVYDYGIRLPISSTSYRFSHFGRVKLYAWWWGGEDATIEVTYSHGFNLVPPDIAAVTMKLALRRLTNPTDVVQEGIGTYSVQYGSRTLPRVGGGATGLTAEEQSVIRRYRGLQRA